MISFRRYDLVILDLLMPLMSGLETLKRIRKIDPSLPVIIVTADTKVNSAVEAMKLGAYDFLTKPVDWNRLHVTVKNALLTRGLTEEVIRLKAQVQEYYGFENIIGCSSRMKEVFRQVERILDSDVTVSIRGESGTGKELLARAIHLNGPRRNKPFVAVNCAAIPETLLESELFGHEKGSFTGAVARRAGKFEQANGGTLFLDEIGEMSASTQVKILRVLQEQRFERVGGNESTEVDVRIISATNKNLEEEMQRGRFREDLYYRISVYPIFLPPLRERRTDIPLLVEFFIEKFNKRTKRKIKGISSRAMDYLINYHWPGNVRELENVLERSMLNATGSVLLPEHLPITVVSYQEDGYHDDSPAAGMDLKKAVALSKRIIPLKEVEKEILKQALKITDYNLSHAALQLGIGRTTLYRKLQRYRIRVER